MIRRFCSNLIGTRAQMGVAGRRSWAGDALVVTGKEWWALYLGEWSCECLQFLDRRWECRVRASYGQLDSRASRERQLWRMRLNKFDGFPSQVPPPGSRCHVQTVTAVLTCSSDGLLRQGTHHLTQLLTFFCTSWQIPECSSKRLA